MQDPAGRILVFKVFSGWAGGSRKSALLAFPMFSEIMLAEGQFQTKSKL